MFNLAREFYTNHRRANIIGYFLIFVTALSYVALMDFHWKRDSYVVSRETFALTLFLVLALPFVFTLLLRLGALFKRDKQHSSNRQAVGIQIIERAFIGYEYIRYAESVRMKEFISEVNPRFRSNEE
jgi:hypothetical protein